MKVILFLALSIAIVLGQTCAPDEDLYDGQCIKKSCFEKYLPRFKTVVGIDGVGRIPITFVGNVQFTNGDVEVLLKFTDEIQEDGTMKRDNTASCIEDKLLRFTKNNYTTSQTDESSTAITSTYDAMNRQRNWKFTIRGQDLQSKLVSDTSVKNRITYRGFYSFRFFVLKQQQVAYNFEFAVELNTQTQNLISTSFKGQVENGQATCNKEDCIAKADTKLEFCSDQSCSSGAQTFTNLFLNQRFWIRQTITTPGFTGFKLKMNTVTYTGTGLNRRTNAVTRKDDAGFQIIECVVDFAYSTPVIINVESNLQAPSRLMFLNDNNNAGRMLQAQGTNGDPASAVADSQPLNCIRCPGKDTCPTQEEAENCSGASLIKVIGMAILIVVLLI